MGETADGDTSGGEPSRVKRVLLGVVGAARDGWLVLGVTLLLVVGLEVAYVAQAEVRRAVFGGDGDAPAPEAPLFPFDTVSWSEEYTLDHMKEENLLWTPYVYFRNPTFQGTHMSVDSAGHRVTPQPEGDGSPVVEVYFMGGSTTFGWFQRDSLTIPAIAARELQDALTPGARLEVTNFGVPGHTFTQEVFELLLRLQAGERPEAVVFYDGINDVMATVQNRAAGIPQNEANRIEDFERGRRIAAREEPGLGNHLRTLAHAAWDVARRLELVQRIQNVRSPSEPPLVPADSAVASLVRIYAENVRIVEALAEEYGFTAVYVWQPALMSSEKRLTEYEAWVRRPAEEDPWIARMREVHVGVPPALRDTVPALVGDRFIDATGLFDGDTLEVYADLFGHTYERANPTVVDTILPVLSDIVARASRRGTSDVAPAR